MKVTKFVIGQIKTNSYAVEVNGNCLVIDPAYEYGTGSIVEYIESSKLNLQGILLTHGHFDHCGGADRLAVLFNAPLYCNKADWQLCNNAKKNIWFSQCKNCFPDRDLSQNFTLNGFNVAVLPTPGHTAGSVCLFIENYLFSGDTLFCNDIGRTDLRESMPDVMKSSLSLLAKIKDEFVIYPGHGKQSSLQTEISRNPYIRCL